MARTNGPIQVWHRTDTIPTDAEGGYAGGDSTAAAVGGAQAAATQAVATVDNLSATATALPPGATPTVTVTGPIPNKVINIGVPRGADGMGYEEGLELTQRAETAETNAEDAATRAGEAAASIGAVVGPGSNLILNPSFEPSPGYGSFNGYISGANIATYAEDTTRKRSGSQSMKITSKASPSAAGGRWERTDLTPDTQLTFSLWVWNPSGNASAVSLMVDSNGSGVTEAVSSAIVDTRDEWVQLRVLFTTGPVVNSTNRVRLWFYAATNGGTTWIDDMGLTEGTTPVSASGDDEGWTWSGQARNSPSVRDEVDILTTGDLTAGALDSPVGALVPNTITSIDTTTRTADGLVRNFIGSNGTAPAQSSLTSPDGQCVPSRNVTRQTIPSGTSGDPVPFGAWDDTLYAFRGFNLYSSTDNGRTWSHIQQVPGTPPSGIDYIHPLGDGEVLLGRGPAGLWKSSGWTADPSTATWTQVIVTSDNGDGHPGDINQWGVSVRDEYVTVAEYDGRFPNRPNSRNVWLSTDYGSNFSVIYDLKDDSNNDGVTGATSHLHCTEIDPWHVTNGNPRIWIDHHDYDNGTGLGGQRIRYSDDLGATWTTWLADTPDAQPTAILATPESVIFGSDGYPDGVFRSRRTQYGMAPLERIWTWRTPKTGLQLIAQRYVRVTDSLAFICFRSRQNGVPGVVVMTDGIHASEVFRTQAISNNQPFVTWASIVGGEFVARDLLTGTGAYDYLVRGTVPAFGQPQGIAVTDATDEADSVTQLNALLASLREAGVIES